MATLVSLISPVNAASDGAASANADADMDRIVVTGTVSAIRLADAGPGYSEVTREDIDRRPALTLADVLDDVVGLNIRIEAQGRGVPEIRGLDQSFTAILINGRRINNTDDVLSHPDQRLSQIPLGAVQRIEVMRSPASAVYGADALGGVINIITRPPGDAWSGVVSGRLGRLDSSASGGDQATASVFVGGPLTDRVGMVATLDRIKADPMARSEESEDDLILGRDAWTAYTSVFWDVDPSTELEFFFNGTDETRDWLRSDRIRSEELQRYTTGAAYAWDQANWSAKVNAYVSKTTNDRLDLSRIDELEDRIFDGNLSTQWAPQQYFSLGFDYRREAYERLRDGQVDLAEQDATHTGLFIQNRSFFLNEKFVVTAGLRHDGHSNYSSQRSPRLGLVYHLSPSLRLKAEYTTGFKAPDLRRSSDDFRNDTPSFTFIGNSALEPERLKSTSAAIEFAGEHWDFGLTLFNNDITDLIVTVPTGAERERIYQNVSKARTRGAEVEASYEFPQGHQLSANYTYVDAENRISGRPLRNRPEESFNLMVEFALGDSTQAFARARYTGTQNLGRRLEKAPGYTVYNVGLRHDLTPKISLRLGLDNVTDVQLIEEDPVFDDREIRGRLYHLGVSYEW